MPGYDLWSVFSLIHITENIFIYSHNKNRKKISVCEKYKQYFLTLGTYEVWL